MTVEEIRELINLAAETGIAELEVQRGDNRVRIRRAAFATQQEFVLAPQSYPAPMTAPPAAAPAAPASVPAPSAHEPPKEKPSDPTQVLVKSPIVGTFYEGPAPGAPPFVQVGSRVQPGQVLCIIESMKLMNEIESETAGIVESKLVMNGQPVEYGEALFAVRTV
ncbi:MAG TPA: acetyl-CoA carboxylase biotin carboxyl carrier protein [Bryobacteraceae bacterium]|jgi:acetyl-CoA carboxylase biotin carboxyl carrier protein|nr:acetyl-CoA carboxylase biotin carboxyl carrier protein [Bryobacteraceae bacterium]